MAKYDFINMDRAPQIDNNPRETFTRFLIGGGYSQPIGRASFNLVALYDVTYSNSSPYASPWVIGGFISL